MTTHNSYGWSITEQLEKGIRGFELDIHDNWTSCEIIKGIFGRKGKFKIGHWKPGHEVYRKDGNPRGNNLEKWFGKIVDWSKNREGHPPITVFLDIKDSLSDWNNYPPEQFGLIRFNEQILNVFKNDKARLFTSRDFTSFYEKQNSWPTIRDLRNKIIVVLMSFHYEKEFASLPTFLRPIQGFLGIPPMHTRLTYQEGRIDSEKGPLNIDPICFVAFNPEDSNKTGFKDSLEEKSLFVTPHPPDIYETYWNNDKLVRTDYKKLKDGSWPPFSDFVNFPVTDNWKDDDNGYLKAGEKKWVI